MELFIDIYPGVFVFRCGNRGGSEPQRPQNAPRRTRPQVLDIIRAMFPGSAEHITDHTKAPLAPVVVLKNAPRGGSVLGFYRTDGSKIFSWRIGDDPMTLLESIGKAAGFTARYGGVMTEEQYERDWC